MIAGARQGGSVQVLIAYGSKRGGTAGLAEMIGDELTAAGLETVVKPARDVRSLDGFDSVVIAGALYAARWHRDARHFVRRHADELRGRPVWLVSSGPLDDSAATGAIPPVKQVAKVMTQIGARGQVTFGGCLESTAKGFPASAMAKKKAGDWRDCAQVRTWAAEVAGEVGHP
jgi:menaquinone-dependent protoporphyrinogen oxidase